MFQCIYGCYVHSAILPTFHRRCYWLLQNPDIVLVHYLNVPYPDDAKLLVVASVSLWAERKEWSKDELISQLRPMCKSAAPCRMLCQTDGYEFLSVSVLSEDEPNLNNELEVSTAETVEAIVSQLMEKQRLARLGGASNGNGMTSLASHPQANHANTMTMGHDPTAAAAVNRSVGCGSHGDAAAKGAMSMSTATNIQHSLRRLSTGSLIRLEPRPQQTTHSVNTNQVGCGVEKLFVPEEMRMSDFCFQVSGNDGLYKPLLNGSESAAGVDQYGGYNGGVKVAAAVLQSHFTASVKGHQSPLTGVACVTANLGQRTPDQDERLRMSAVNAPKQESSDYYGTPSGGLNVTAASSTPVPATTPSLPIQFSPFNGNGANFSGFFGNDNHVHGHGHGHGHTHGHGHGHSHTHAPGHGHSGPYANVTMTLAPLTSASNNSGHELRRTDEMLSAHSYRCLQLTCNTSC